MDQVSHTLSSTFEHETLFTFTPSSNGMAPIVSFSCFICSLIISIVRLNIIKRSSGSQVAGTQIVSIGCKAAAAAEISSNEMVYIHGRPWISTSFQVPRAFTHSSYWPRSIMLPSSRPEGILDEASITGEKFCMVKINIVFKNNVIKLL